MVNTVLAFDVGGTYLRCAAVDLRVGELVARVGCDVPDFGQPDDAGHDAPGAMTPAILRHHDLADLMEDLAREVGLSTPTRIGVAYPGPVTTGGTALAAPTLCGDAAGFPVDVLAVVQNRWPDATVRVINDLTAAGYGQRRTDEFCVLNIGSGIGHKVFVAGHPLIGAAGLGGEIGHLRVEWGPDALPCDCGGAGHLGGVASGRGALAAVRRAIRHAPDHAPQAVHNPELLDSGAIAALFRAGEPWVTGVIELTAQHLGMAIAAIHLGTGVQTFVVLGGWAHALGQGYVELLQHYADAASWHPARSAGVRIELADTAADDVLFGAALAAASHDG